MRPENEKARTHEGLVTFCAFEPARLPDRSRCPHFAWDPATETRKGSDQGNADIDYWFSV